ncbi:MAG: GNAT family protein [Actinomycetota bacterium]
MAHPAWPLYDLVIRTPKVEIRIPTDDEWMALLLQVDERLYESTGVYPFTSDWVSQPCHEGMQFYWRTKAEWTAASWTALLTIFLDGEPVGVQAIDATNFAVLRTVSTGSWLVPRAQGRGIGTEMRAAVLHFAFAGLGALEAHSEAHVANEASLAITRVLGYEFTHMENATFAGERVQQWHTMLRREVWERHPLHQRDDITIEGLDELTDWFIDPAG